ncbi:MAG: hypothetical protein GXY44_11535 [Phycisphaerales bacterium]|nr:hypothetical protein [Phycisphaerales bacterium]
MKTPLAGRRRRRWPYLTVAVLAGLAALSASAEEEPVVNSLPVASDVSYLLEPGTSVRVTLSAYDADGDSLSYIITALPAGGTVTVGSVQLGNALLPYTIPNNGRELTYEAATEASGVFTLRFKANDGTGDSNVGTVTLTVNRAPQPVDILFITEPNTDLTIEWPVTDAPTDKLTFTILSLPGRGRIMLGGTPLTDDDLPYVTDRNSILYTPDEDYHGPDSFAFVANDGLTHTDTLFVRIEVNTAPVPDPVSVMVLPDGQANIVFSSFDADRDPVRYVIVSLPAHGILTDQGAPITENSLPRELGEGVGHVQYTVNMGYQGTDGFQYRVRDYISFSDRVAVKITVNTPPQAHGSSLRVAPGGTVETVLSPTDEDGDALSVRFPRLPEKGELSIDGRPVSRTDTLYDVPASGLVIAYTPNVPEPPEEEGDAGEAADDDSSTKTTVANRGGERGGPSLRSVDDQDSFTWLATDGKEDSDTVTVSIRITDQAETPDNPTFDGDDVLSSTPSTAVGACGAAGAAELLMLAFTLFIAPRTRYFRKIRAPSLPESYI